MSTRNQQLPPSDSGDDTTLEESAARFRAIWEAAGDAMALSDPDGIVLAANPAYCALYGYTVDEVVGQSFAVIFPEDLRAWAIEEYRRAFTAPMLTPAVESVIRTKDGVQRTVEARYTFLIRDGRRVAMLSVVRDITERKLAEAERDALLERERQARREAEAMARERDEAYALLDTLFAQAPVGLGFWDRALRFVRVNSALAEMNGLPPEAHLGKTPAELLPGLVGVETIMAGWREILATGEPLLGVEVSGETPAAPGSERHWVENWFPVRVRGEIVGIGAVVEEVTARKRAEGERTVLLAREQAAREAAEAAVGAKNELLAAITHDLRGPLTTIKSTLR